MDMSLRKLLFVLVIALGIAACGGEDEPATAEVADETTTTQTPETTSTTSTTTTTAPTTTLATSTTTEVPATDAAIGTSAGVAAFGNSVLDPENLTGIGDADAACIREGFGDLDTSAGFEALSLDDQVSTIEAGLDCVGFALRPAFIDSFTSSGNPEANLFDALGAEAGDCFFGGIAVDDADQANRIAALVYANAEAPAPEAAIEPGANLLADCADFNVIFTALAGDDPTLQAGIDQTCVDETFDRPTAVGLYSDLLADPAALDGGAVPESLNGLFACFNIGELILEQFGGSDLVSEEEIECLNGVFQSPEIVSGLVASGGGGAIPPEALTALFGCLDPETLGGVVGTS